MKNKLFLMIMVVMVCSLTACGQQETETMTNTGNSIEQVVTSEDKEFRGVLDEIDSDIQPGTAGNGMNSIKTAVHLLNWGGLEPV